MAVRHFLYATVPIILVCLGGCVGHPQPEAVPSQPVVTRLAGDTTELPGIAAEQFVARDTTLRAAVARYLIDWYSGYSRVRIDDQVLPPSLDAKASRTDGATTWDARPR